VQQEEKINLSPIIDADPIPFTMDTLGWKVLFVIVFLTILFIAYKYYLKYKHNAYRREAIAEIQALIKNETESSSALISKIMFLIKQTALQTYDRKTVASLEGEKWLDFLDNSLNKSFYKNHQEVIASAIYKNEFDNTRTFNPNDFANMSIKWIKNHA
jgi:hypothetical protein